MSASQVKFVPYEMKIILLRIYSYKDKNICGAIGHTSLESDIAFSNFGQLIFSVEKILDEMQFPQRNLELRVFKKDAPKMKAPLTDDGDKKALATFKLNILFRQNASWQGSLAWLEDKSEVQFRSVLEFIQLLDSVLSS